MARSLVIDETEITEDSDCYVVAELGCNHMGSVDTAKEMIRFASFCKVNAVKLQKRDNRALFTRQMFDSPYINRNSFGETYGTHREALELDRDAYVELIACAKEHNVTLFATPFDFPSVDFLADLDMPAYKTASGDITNTPLLKYVAEIGKPMMVSTGGATMEDVERAHDAIVPINSQLCIMQCTSSYPAAADELNLKVIETYRERFGDIVVGLSDHQNGIAMAMLAFMLWARMIEKHFTINRAWKGTDQAFSLEPAGMGRLVRDLQRARVALGDGVKQMFPDEKEPLHKMRKKLVAAKDVPTGQILSREDLTIKAPGDGLAPYYLDEVIGMTATRPLAVDDDIKLEYLRK